MKHFSRTTYFLIFVFIICSMSLTSCRTMRMSEKAVSESETASVTASRLTFYRTIDSLSRHMSLSFDSASIIFWPESPEFPRAYPSGIERLLETPADSVANKVTPKVRKRLRNASRSEAASRPAQVPSYLQRPSGPLALKIYGFHVTTNSDKKSVINTDLKDSVAIATQSQKYKSAKKQKAAPTATLRWLPIILISIFCISIALILIRFIHKHTFLV